MCQLLEGEWHEHIIAIHQLHPTFTYYGLPADRRCAKYRVTNPLGLYRAERVPWIQTSQF